MKQAACFLWAVTCTLGCAHPVHLWTTKFPERIGAASIDSTRDAIPTTSSRLKMGTDSEPVPKQSSQSSFIGTAIPFLHQSTSTQHGKASLDAKPLISKAQRAERDGSLAIGSKRLPPGRDKDVSGNSSLPVEPLKNNSATASRGNRSQGASSQENRAETTSTSGAVEVKRSPTELFGKSPPANYAYFSSSSELWYGAGTICCVLFTSIFAPLLVELMKHRFGVGRRPVPSSSVPLPTSDHLNR
jgi:hypothetical protein